MGRHLRGLQRLVSDNGRSLRRLTPKGIVTVTVSGGPTGEGQQWRHEATPRPSLPSSLSAEIFSHAVWLYHVFSLSLRDVELLLAERGVVVSYETVRRWCKKFGQSFVNRLRHRRPRLGDKWHLDEVFIRIQGVQHYLWRAVDQEGVVLHILVQERRDGKAASAGEAGCSAARDGLPAP
jgi:hypothetical protein